MYNCKETSSFGSRVHCQGLSLAVQTCSPVHSSHFLAWSLQLILPPSWRWARALLLREDWNNAQA